MTGGVYPPPANDEPDDLRDPALSDALDHAPDHAELPDWRTRKSILDHAHDAVAASRELMAAGRAASPWWTLDWWLRRATSRAHMPWNAAFATVLVAVLATLLWHREPVPDARLDERQGSAVREPKTGNAQDQTNAGDTDRMASEAPPTGQATRPAAPASTGGSTASQDMSRRAGDEARALPSEPPPTPLAEPHAPAQLPATPPVPNAAPAPSPAAPPAAASSAGEAAALRKSRSQSAQQASASATPSASAASSAPSAADSTRAASASDAPARSRAAESAAKLAAPADAAGAPRAPAQAAAPSSKVRTDETPPPNFASLSQWTEMRVANIGGEVRVLSRDEGGELNLLLNSAAIMASGPQPLKALPDWRVSLEKKGAVLAVLELARNQVRWTEGGAPPATGVPPPGSLDALRAALAEAVKAAPAKSAAPARRPTRQRSADAPAPDTPPGDEPAGASRR